MYPVKSDGQTYAEHIHKCMEAWQEIWLKREKQTMHFAAEYNIPYLLLRQKSMISILFHDLGKLTDNFLDIIQAVIEGRKVNRAQYFRHEIPSAIFLFEYWLARKNKGLDNSAAYEVWAVLGHHKTLDPFWNSFEREKQIDQWPTVPEKRLQYAKNLALEYLEAEGIPLLAPAKNVPEDTWKDTLFMILDQTMIMANNETKRDLNATNRQIYSLIKGMLHYCDWWASSHDIKYHYFSPVENEYVLNQLKQKLNLGENEQFNLRPFQRQCANQKGDVIAIAPTGSGKTEAAVLWAVFQQTGRFIILMPTQVTSNSLFERMQQLVDSECGLCHSGAQTYFSLYDEDQANGAFSWLHFKAFMPPVMVATVDQILSSGFNTGLWSHKEFALLGTAVIIDEIHAYDTFTLGLISATVRKIKSLGGTVMLMSATMPKVLRNHFAELLSVDHRLILAEERMDLARNTWVYLDSEVDELDEYIEGYLRQGKKVAIVVNRIATAKLLYKKWSPKYECMCYHSEFIMLDRIEKEKRIDSVQLLISTQAIEVSLEIDYDIMLTECAPLDCLIQRAGRVNRYGKKEGTHLIVFKASDITRKYVYKRNLLFLERTEELLPVNQGQLTESDLNTLLEKVYEDYDLYDEHYHEAIRIYEIINSREGIFDLPFKENTENKTRLFEYEKISIIPICYFDAVEELVKTRKYEKIALYEVPIGANVYFKLKRNNRLKENDYKLPIMTVDYSSDFGINLEDIEKGYIGL